MNKLSLALSLALLLVPISAAASEGKAECVVEISSLRLIREKDAEKKLPMASTTKILTAIIIIDDCRLDEVLTVPEEAEGTEGSSVYLRAGETYSVRELLYGLMLRSGNDCAVTLALHHSGSLEKFAQVMTERAAALGAENSYFMNPHGLPDEKHFTTARDLALVSAYAMENETFREIVSCKFYSPRGWKNKNKMLFEYDGAIGVKTGFTVAAGRCLVTSAEREGMSLLCVVLNCPEMYERTKELLDDAFESYKMYPLLDAEEGYEGFEVKRSFSYPLKKEELRSLSFKKELFDPLPEKSGEVAGQISIYLENSLLFSENLYIMEGSSRQEVAGGSFLCGSTNFLRNKASLPAAAPMRSSAKGV